MGLRWGIGFNTSNFPAADSAILMLVGKSPTSNFPAADSAILRLLLEKATSNFPTDSAIQPFTKNSFKLFS